MSLATLSIDLEARLAALQQGLDKAGRLAEKESARMAKAFNVASTALAGIGAGIGLGGITAFFAGVVNGLDALNDLADATGASIENLSALEDVAMRTGTSLDTVGSALVKFNSVLKDAKPGSDAAAALQALGLNAEELKRIDPAEALRQTAVALAGFADDGNKARIVQELFGKSVKDAAPFLKDLAEQGALVGKVTKEQAEEAEKLNKQLFELQKNSVDVARAIAGPLASSFNQLFDAVRGGGVGSSSPISEFITVPLQAVSVLAANVAFVLKGIGTEIGGIAAQAGSLLKGDFAGAKFIGQSLRADSKAAREEFDALEKRLMSIGTVLPQASYSNEGRIGSRPSLPGSLGGPPAAPGGNRRGGSSRPEFGAAITDSSELTRNLFLASEKDYEEIDKALKRTEERAREAAEALRKSLIDEGRAVFEATRTPLEKLNIELARQQELLDALGPSYRDTYERAVFAAQDAADAAIKVPEELKKASDLAKDLGLTFSSAFEDAIVGGNSLRDVLKGLEQDLLRIITRKLITEPLGNAVSGAVSGFDFSSLLALLPSFDVGTDYVPRDMVAKVHKGERILTAAENRAGGGGVVVNVNMAGAQVASRATAQQQAEMIGRQVRLAVARNG